MGLQPTFSYKKQQFLRICIFAGTEKLPYSDVKIIEALKFISPRFSVPVFTRNDLLASCDDSCGSVIIHRVFHEINTVV